jgi:hypothetical protein
VTLLFSLVSAPRTNAQTPAQVLVLVPFEQPGGSDPHAVAITQLLTAGLGNAGLVIKSVAPMDHLDGVANAANLCKDNGATGILAPEGRYEQTKKTIPAPFVTIVRYPTHVELRLDEMACDGSLRWTSTTVGDTSRTSAQNLFNIGTDNLGSDVDAAYRIAIDAAVKARGSASVTETSPDPNMVPRTAAVPASIVADTPPPPLTYLLVPYEQPGISDPRGSDITHSLLTALQKKSLTVVAGKPVDHETTIASAGQLCTENKAQNIIVPDIRIEQSSYTGRSHASMLLTLLDCNGAVVSHGAGEADMGSGFMANFGAAVVGVTERAMPPAIAQLFPPIATGVSVAPK